MRQKTWNNFMPSILNFPPSLFLKSATVLTIVRATIQYSTHVPSSPLRIGDIHCDCEQRKKTKNATKPKFKSDYNFSHRYICTTLYYAINTIDPTEDLPSFSTWITEQRSWVTFSKNHHRVFKKNGNVVQHLPKISLGVAKRSAQNCTSYFLGSERS